MSSSHHDEQTKLQTVYWSERQLQVKVISELKILFIMTCLLLLFKYGYKVIVYVGRKLDK